MLTCRLQLSIWKTMDMVMEARLRSKMTVPGAKIIHQAQRKVKTLESLKGRQNKYQSYCDEFQKKNGACMKKGCRFVHFDPESASRSRTRRQNNNQRNYRDNQTPRPSPRRKTNNLYRNTRSSNKNGHKPSQRYNKHVCYKFQNTGTCPYGNRCKFRHIQQHKLPTLTV